MKAILFCRVSSKEQEETGYSLPAQEKLLREHTMKCGLAPERVFSISESAGGQRQREIFGEMIRYAEKNGIKVIVCEKVDRLTRNLKDAVAINEWLNDDPERQVHFVKEGVILSKDSRSNEKFIWNIKVSVAQYYIDNLSEEVKKGQKEKLAQGWLPTKPPLGYKTVGTQGHKIHVIDEQTAPLVRKMFELYSSGDYSVKRVVKAMNETGLRNRLGRKLVLSRVHQLLTDPFYVGKNQWLRKTYEGKQEPLISREMFERVQQILRRKAAPRYRKHRFLFQSLIKCAECGGSVTWETHKEHVYGHCNHYHECGQTAWSKEELVLEQVVSVFDELRIKNQRFSDWVRRLLKESHKDEIAFRTASLEELYRQREQLQQRLDRLYDDKLDGKITEEFYQRKSQQYSGELSEMNDSIRRHDTANQKYYELGINFYELSQMAKDIFLKADTDKRRQLVRLVFEKLTLNGGNLDYDYTKAFDLLSQAVKSTNGSKLPKTWERMPLTFEPSLKIEETGNYGNFLSLHSVMLPGLDSNQRP